MPKQQTPGPFPVRASCVTIARQPPYSPQYLLSLMASETGSFPEPRPLPVHQWPNAKFVRHICHREISAVVTIGAALWRMRNNCALFASVACAGTAL
jgi:hypothetical protein